VIIAFIACLAAVVLLLRMLREQRLSLGLPLAYIASLLIIHVPGALAHFVSSGVLEGSDYVELGFKYTAIGAVCFVAGVWLARRRSQARIEPGPAPRREFAAFCLVGGWVFVFGLTALARIPSLGALIASGGAIWMLGVLLGLKSGVQSGSPQRVLLWTAALAVYPLFMLLMGGFLSYGSAAVIIVVSVMAILARSYARAAVGITLATFVGLTGFVNYFEHRDDFRASVWGGAPMGTRLDSIGEMIDSFHFIDLGSDRDLIALDQRLNQNMFVGLSAARLQDGQAEYLKGQSVTDGLISLVPRALWPNKPVKGGSGTIVAEMTGMRLNEDTSWGVGNVMEFYINFGVAGVIGGFFGLGWLLGFLDYQAAAAERRGDLRRLMICFLPAVALIQPGASIVEMSGSAGAGLIAAYGWAWLWNLRNPRSRQARQTRDGLRMPGAEPGSDLVVSRETRPQG
jgi:hypothetical protein